MRKAVVALLLVVVSVCAICLTACDYTNDTSYPFNRTVDITVYTDGEAEEYAIKIGEVGKIAAKTKEGYYLKGFYTQPDGGEMYFDYSGESVAKWESSFPTAFYAQWESISGYQSDVQHWGDRYSFMYNVDLRLEWKLSGQRLLSIVNSNKDRKIIIKFIGKITAPIDHVYLYFQDKQYSGAEVFASKYINISVGKYVNFAYEVEVPAKIFANENKMYFRFSFSNDYYGFSSGYVNELAASFTFV